MHEHPPSTGEADCQQPTLASSPHTRPLFLAKKYPQLATCRSTVVSLSFTSSSPPSSEADDENECMRGAGGEEDSAANYGTVTETPAEQKRSILALRRVVSVAFIREAAMSQTRRSQQNLPTDALASPCDSPELS